MDEQTLKSMSMADLVKYIDEQKALGKNGQTQTSIAKILGINPNTFKSRINTFKNKGEQMNIMSEQTSTPITQESTQKEQKFTESEIKALKSIIKERERDIQVFHEYRIYSDLERVPVDAESVRSAFNMSKATTERLRKYASVRRLPLQDIVELAVIKLLDEYDK